MHLPRFVRLTLCALSAAIAICHHTAALACTCCTEIGHRYVEVEKLDDYKLSIFRRLRIGKFAGIDPGTADDAEWKKIETLSGRSYEVTLARETGRMAFNFRGDDGSNGKLTLTIPKEISIFEVDPRVEAGLAVGPQLYKEWKLTAPAVGNGLFKDVLRPGHKMTLILHGRGLACTEAEEFHSWTLVVHGKTPGFRAHGWLEKPAAAP